MNVPALLASLRERDILVSADGDHLRCSAPPGTLTSELRVELRQCKQEILDFLRSAGSLAQEQSGIVPLQPRGSLPPIFAFGGHNGDIFCFRALARHLGDGQPFFGLQPPGLDGEREPLTRVEDLAAYFAAEIRSLQSNAPCVIAGFCAGGAIAFELARQLLQSKAALKGLALFGAPYPTSYHLLPKLRRRLVAQTQRLMKHALGSLLLCQKRLYLAEKLRGRKAQPAAGLDPLLARRDKVARATFAALRRYLPGHFAGTLSLFLPCRRWARSLEQPLRWRSVAERAEEYFGPDDCNTDIMLLEPHAPIFARLFRQSQGTSASNLARIGLNALRIRSGRGMRAKVPAPFCERPTPSYIRSNDSQS